MKDTVNFLELIASFRRGTLVARADAELEKVISAMHETGGDGKLTITLPFKLNKSGQIECKPKVEAKIPTADVGTDVGTGVYFASEDGALSRRDPMQMDIEDEIAARRTGH